MTYFIDTSEWINLIRSYPGDVFPSLWSNIERLISRGRVLSPKEVRDEIERGDNELTERCRNHPKMLQDAGAPAPKVQKIISEHPAPVNPNAPHESAGPYIIAQAVHCKNCTSGSAPITVQPRTPAGNHAYLTRSGPTAWRRAG